METEPQNVLELASNELTTTTVAEVTWDLPDGPRETLCLQLPETSQPVEWTVQCEIYRHLITRYQGWDFDVFIGNSQENRLKGTIAKFTPTSESHYFEFEAAIKTEYQSPAVYYGAVAKRESIDSYLLGSNAEATSVGLAFVFSSRPVAAMSYASKLGPSGNLSSPEEISLYCARLKFQNPYWNDFERTHHPEESYESIVKRAKAAGHDGVILQNTFDRGGEFVSDIYIAFSREQMTIVERIEGEETVVLLEQALGAYFSDESEGSSQKI